MGSGATKRRADDRTEETRPMNLVERLLDWERREPQRVWLCQPIDDVERRYTFAQAADDVRRAAMAIRALGLPAGSRIAVSGRKIGRASCRERVCQEV